MTKAEKAEFIRDCYYLLLELAVDARSTYVAGGEQDVVWRTWDAIIADLQVARERAVRKALK